MDRLLPVFVDRATMAKLLSISVRLLDEWVRDGMPGVYRPRRRGRVLFDPNPEPIKAWALKRSGEHGKHHR